MLCVFYKKKKKATNDQADRNGNLNRTMSFASNDFALVSLMYIYVRW